MRRIDEENIVDANEYYVEDQGLQGMMEHGGKKAIYTVAYFLFLAALMFPAAKLHLGEQGVFASMIGAAILLFLVVWIVKRIHRKMENMQISRKGFIQMMVGYSPHMIQPTYEEEVSQETGNPTRTHATTALVPLCTRELATAEDEPDETVPDRIIEENGLYLADRFMPSIQGILGTIVLLCGIRRMGKSNLLAVFVEEMARYILPMLVIDTDDEYSALAKRTYMSRGFLAGSRELQQLQHSPLKNYIVVDVNNAFSIGLQILQDSLQVVLNMKSFSTDEEAAHVLCEIISGMNAWEAAKPNINRIPVFLYMDEASKWLPEQTGRSVVSKHMQARLFKTFFGTVVNRGGKQGFGCVFATQRIQDINKSALQAPWKYLFYQAQKVDLEQYETFGLQSEDVLTLRQGECYIFAPHVIGFRCFMRERFSEHLGHTPGLEALKAHQQKTLRPVQTLHFNDLVGMEEHTADPETERRTYGYRGDHNQPRHAETEPHPASTATAVPTIQGVKVSPKQKLAYDLYIAGNQTIVKLAAAMTQNGMYGRVDANQAYQLRNQLEALGLIQPGNRSSRE